MTNYSEIVLFINALSTNDKNYFTEGKLGLSYLTEFNLLIDKQEHIHKWFTRESIIEGLNYVALLLNRLQFNLPNVNEYGKNNITYLFKDTYPFENINVILQLINDNAIVKAKAVNYENSLNEYLYKGMVKMWPELNTYFYYEENRIDPQSKVVAKDGIISNNHLKHYFSKGVSTIEQKDAIAYLTPEVKDSDIEYLASLWFKGFGLYPYVPKFILLDKTIKVDKIYENIESYHYLLQNNHYANSYEYNRSLLLFNKTKHFDNGFLILKESDDLRAPIGVINFKYVENIQEAQVFVQQNLHKIFVALSEKAIVENIQHLKFGDYKFPCTELNLKTENNGL